MHILFLGPRRQVDLVFDHYGPRNDGKGVHCGPRSEMSSLAFNRMEMMLYLLLTTNRASLSGPPQKSRALKTAE